MMGRKVVLMDIDGTISDPSHRLHLIPVGEDAKVSSNWVPFADGCINDAPVKKMIEISNSLAESFIVFVLTSRSEISREQTEKWLGEHGVKHDGVLMRTEGDFRPSPVVKKEIIQTLIDEGADIMGFFDDHDGNIETASSFGFPTMRVKV